MFLSDEDVTALTGKRQTCAQRKALNAMGIAHKVRPDGSLAVLERYLEQEMGLAAPKARSQPNIEPNWEAL